MVAACDGGEDLAGLTAVQNVPVTLAAAEVENGALSGEGQLTPETFLTRVETELDHDVTSIEVTGLRLSLANPKVTAWTELFSGQITVALVPDSTGNALIAGYVEPSGGTADLEMSVVIDADRLAQNPDVAAGRFAVRVTGPAAAELEPTLSQAVLVRLEVLAF